MIYSIAATMSNYSTDDEEILQLYEDSSKSIFGSTSSEVNQRHSGSGASEISTSPLFSHITKNAGSKVQRRRSTVDPDDDVWESFNAELQFERQRLRRASLDGKLEDVHQHSLPQNNRKKADTNAQNLVSRLRKRKIFNMDYTQSARQARECMDLIESLGIENTSDRNISEIAQAGNSGGGFGMSQTQLNKRALSLLTNNSVLLKQGPILLDQGEHACEWYLRDEDIQTRELIILSNAFFVCTVSKNEYGVSHHYLYVYNSESSAQSSSIWNSLPCISSKYVLSYL
mmetsp:Transcript_17044/g.25357  ORF Transcript_17044/g.25357 Transcript_17044/m.25357 type:complete len:286 (-) Transcript_17044:47-904(-)